MKLAIRNADKIVGASVILGLGILAFALIMMGVNQRWFARDYMFVAYFESAAGLSQNMPVQALGLSIGQVRSIRMTEDDMVEVRFAVFDTYIDRAREGSRVELVVSPIPILGNQFLFHPGQEEGLIPEHSVVPSTRSDDAIGAIISDAGSIISNVDALLVNVNEALMGTEGTTLGRSLLEVEGTLAAVQQTVGGIDIDGIIEDVLGMVIAMIEPLLDPIIEGIADPDGMVMSILDGEGDVYASLVASLDAVSGTLRNLETITGLPQILAILLDLQLALRNVNDTLVAVNNNPLLRRGVPARAETGPGGTFARDIEF